MDELRKAHYKTIWVWYAIVWLGFWLLTAQAAFGYREPMLLWSDCISGLLLIFLGALSISYKRIWTPWFIVFVGVWLQFAPLLFWAEEAGAYLNDTLVGTLAIALSIIIPGMPGRLSESGPSIPPGWSYNPSSWPQRLPIVILGTVGWFISRYLAAVQLGYIDLAWDPIFDLGMQQVITSDVSKEFPVSDAGLGAAVYTLEVLLALKGDERRWRTMPWMVFLFGFIVVPLGLVSVTLIILQPLIVGSWFTLCLCSAFCMVVMIAYAIDEVFAVFQFLHLKWLEGKPFWKTFWKGDPCFEAETDTRTPPLDSSLPSLFSSASWGISIPWNLFLSTILGIFLMLAPWIFHLSKEASDLDHVIGAFTIVISIISMAEVIRKVQIFNILLGGTLIVFLFWSTESWLVNLIVGSLLILLSFHYGKIREQYGNS